MEDAKRALTETGAMMRTLRESLGFPVLRGKVSSLIQQSIPQQQLQTQSGHTPQMGQVEGGKMVAKGIAPLSQVGLPHQPTTPLPQFETPSLIKQKFGVGGLLPIRSAVSDFITTMGRTAELKAKSEAEAIQLKKEELAKPKPPIHLRSG